MQQRVTETFGNLRDIRHMLDDVVVSLMGRGEHLNRLEFLSSSLVQQSNELEEQSKQLDRRRLCSSWCLALALLLVAFLLFVFTSYIVGG